jgi:hypothetical protein
LLISGTIFLILSVTSFFILSRFFSLQLYFALLILEMHFSLNNLRESSASELMNLKTTSPLALLRLTIAPQSPYMAQYKLFTQVLSHPHTLNLMASLTAATVRIFS